MLRLVSGLLALVVLLLVVVFVLTPRHRPHRPPHHRPSHHHIIGGCKGVRWGCCSNGVTPKANRRGTNCPKL